MEFIGVILWFLYMIGLIYVIGKILGSRSMGIGSKLVLVALIIGATVGLYQLTEVIPSRRQQTFSEAFRKAFEELVEERGELPMVPLSGDKKLTDAKMILCRYNGDLNRWIFTSEHIPKKNRAASPEETDVVIVQKDAVKVYGQYRYESGITMEAYQRFYIITAIDVRNKARLAERTIYGDPPAKEIHSKQGTAGPYPDDKDVERYIVSLIDGSTYQDGQKDTDTIEVPAEELPY